MQLVIKFSENILHWIQYYLFQTSHIMCRTLGHLIIFCLMLLSNCSMSLCLPHSLDSEVFKGKEYHLHFSNHF